jgi:predicted transcriptional regulator
MELEPLISGSKWTILELLSEKPCSPTELAEKTSTSLANISQQLRLLEITGIVKKEKQQSREKGKPHMLYSLNQEYGYVVSMCNQFSKKRLIPVTEYHKAVLKIWCLTDVSAHKAIDKFYLDIEKYLAHISLLATTADSKKIVVVVKDREIEKKISDIKSELEVETLSEKNKARIPVGIHVIYHNW